MDASGLRFYKLDRWSAAFGEWPLVPFAVEEVVREVVAKRVYSEKASSCLLVNLILEGGLLYRCDGGDFHVEAGELLVVPLKCQYSFHAEAGTRYRKLVLEFSGVGLPGQSAVLGLDRPLLLKGVDLGAPEKAIREIGELLRGGELESLPEIQSRCAWILAWLSLAARKSTDPETRLLAKARAVLDNDFENAGIERLAERLGVSYSYLNKLFHRRLGVSPVKYRTASRIALAENLLGDLSISIKELSRRLGYANQLRFSNDFKKNRGLSPKAFRESRC